VNEPGTAATARKETLFLSLPPPPLPPLPPPPPPPPPLLLLFSRPVDCRLK
jgi:hypothetical protein